MDSSWPVAKIRPVNPVAKALALSRRRASVLPPKKGKGSYDRNKQKRNYVPEDSGKEKDRKAMQDWRRNRKASRKAKQQMQDWAFNATQ